MAKNKKDLKKIKLKFWLAFWGIKLVILVLSVVFIVMFLKKIKGD